MDINEVKQIPSKKLDCKQEDLNQFYGTSAYYRHWMRNYVYTDGVKYVADHCGAYWLLDNILSYQTDKKIRKVEFQVWKLNVDLENETAILTMEDGNGKVLVSTKIPYTDFPLEKIEIWLENNTLYLPSER